MMPDEIRTLFADRASPDRDVSYQALVTLFEMADEPVEWAYDVWDDLLEDLADPKGSTRAFTAQMLARLAISDPEARILRDFPRVAAVMKDEKAVTARHTLQSLWRIGLAGPEQRELVVSAYEGRFRECAEEKGGRIVRRDVLAGLGRLWKACADDRVKERAHALMSSEPADKERTHQLAAWQKAVE